MGYEVSRQEILEVFARTQTNATLSHEVHSKVGKMVWRVTEARSPMSCEAPHTSTVHTRSCNWLSKRARLQATEHIA